MLAVLTFSIRPGRVPECRALLRAAGDPPGRIDRRFVEIGEVNTIIVFCTAENGEELARLGLWAAARRDEARDILRGVTLEAFAAPAPEGLAAAPVVLAERGGPDGMPALAGEPGLRLNLVPLPSADACLAAAAARRAAGIACRNAMLIPENL